MTDRTIEGEWWIPQNSELRIGGTLVVGNDNVGTLRLAGAFPRGEKYRTATIHGNTTAGAVSLYRVFLRETTTWMQPKQDVSTWEAWTTIVGFHADALDCAAFSQLHIKYDDLEKWVFPRGALDLDYADDGESVRITTTPGTSTNATSAAADDVKISIRRAGLYCGHSELNATVERRTFAIIEAVGDEKPFPALWNYVRSIQDFLTLAITKPTGIESVSGFTDDCMVEGAGGDHHQPVDIYHVDAFAKLPRQSTYYHEWWFEFDDIADKFGALLQHWIASREKLSPIITLYFATLYSQGMFQENRFLNLAQAAESYHRHIHGGAYMAKDEYDERVYRQLVGAIPEGIEKDFRASMTAKLNYLNEYSLRKRLNDLVGSLPDSPRGVFRQVDRFVSNALNTRNYLTHFDASLSEKAKQGYELDVLSDHLQYLLEILLLREAGFDDADISAMAERRKHDLRRLHDYR